MSFSAQNVASPQKTLVEKGSRMQSKYQTDQNNTGTLKRNVEYPIEVTSTARQTSQYVYTSPATRKSI